MNIKMAEGKFSIILGTWILLICGGAILFILKLLTFMFVFIYPTIIALIMVIVMGGISSYKEALKKEKQRNPAAVYTAINDNRKILERDEKLNQIIEKINLFNPFRKYSKENQYQMQLGGYLQTLFEKVRIEGQIGSSRPDIIVDDEIAIEIKGPTTMDELKTLPDKCMRYPDYYKEVVVVLFDIQLSNEKLESYLNLLRNIFPKIIIIKK